MSIINQMVYGLIAYFLAYVAIVVVLRKKSQKVFAYPKIIVKDFSLIFVSYKQHKMKIGEAKVLDFNSFLVVRSDGRFVKLKNIKSYFVSKGYLYFVAKGKVQIEFNKYSYFYYLRLDVKTTFVDFEREKQSVLSSLLDSPFEQHTKLVHFINFMRNTLKINVDMYGIEIQQNDYKLSFVVRYFAKGKYKKVYIN